MEQVKFKITNIKQITMTEIQNSKRFYDFEEEKPNLFRSLDTRPVKFRLKADPRKARDLTG
jgi:hypothetical protein